MYVTYSRDAISAVTYLCGLLPIHVRRLALLPADFLFPEGLTDSLVFPQAQPTLLVAPYVTQHPNFSLFFQAKHGTSAVWQFWIKQLLWHKPLSYWSPMGNCKGSFPKCRQLPKSHQFHKLSMSQGPTLLITLFCVTSNLILINFSTFVCFHLFLYHFIFSIKINKILNNKSFFPKAAVHFSQELPLHHFFTGTTFQRPQSRRHWLQRCA